MQIEEDCTSSPAKKISSIPRNLPGFENSDLKSTSWNPHRLSVDYVPTITTNEKYSSRKSSTNSSVNQNKTNKKIKKKKLRTPCEIFKDAIPKMSKPLAIICCIANILTPGIGKRSIRFNYSIRLKF